MSHPPLRGRSVRERRLAEKVARDWAERRAAAARKAESDAVDFDVAEVDREVGDAREAAERADRADRAERQPRDEIRPERIARSFAATGGPPGSTAPRAGRRLPDLSVLPPLLAETGSFGSLLERIGRPREPTPASGRPGRGRHAGLTTVPHGAKSYLAAALVLGAGERVCWVARDAEIGDRVAEELGAWLGDADTIVVLEPRTALAFERSELVPDETAARVAALSAWRNGRARVMVASVQALLQHTLAVEDLPVEPRLLRVGSRADQATLLRDLLDLGYSPVAEVAGRGEFARRGGIVDVFPPSEPLPLRIELFGDEIDSIRAFDPADQRAVGPLDGVSLLPATEFLLPREGAAALRERLGRLARRLPGRLATDLERFEATTDEMPAGAAIEQRTTRALHVGDAAEVWAGLLAPSTGLDHVGPETLFILDEPGDTAEASEFLWRQAEERRAELEAGGDLPPNWPSTYLGSREWKSRLLASRTLELTWESEPQEGVGFASGRLSSGDLFGWREPRLPALRTLALGEAFDRWRADGTRIVLASDQAPRLAELLAEAGHPTAPVNRVSDAPPPGAIALVERSLNGGFEGGPERLAFVTDRELFGSVRVRRPKALRRVVPRDILERLTPGDLVVHVDHGIARYEQMLRRSGGADDDRDYLELSFAGGDKIFVPVEQINRLSRYSGGEHPQLSRLGGTEWLRTKQRVRKAVDDLAQELLELYAARSAARGHAFGDDTPWQGELEASFPYEETLDQLRAITEVKVDMEAGRPMDRLVVGDVGYGKTEVALRAAFKAIQDGMQVAVLVPTTVLADQHYRTFGQRFGAFPITVRLLSRFVSKADQERAVAGLADGSVDLVIGTHRLLSKDVSFRNLGLVVVDEEQRFGVSAKERLKRLRREVDVVTLSATPIPRTLNLALAGVRDLSVIETPPEDRLPIQTRVAEASAGLVRDAILRELDRGGQVFYVHNRVETIEAQAEQLRRMLPDARIVVGHGQMAEGALERVMLGFANGEADVLVCTTIIESGLDIPNANTILIDRADTLGLAQLYQLRGRVGRSSRRAYAYLLYRRRERLSDVSRKRLQAIFNASELGAGFQIALADLEIRGAGNILGAEQSGHMAAVGFDLYTRLLGDAVEEKRALLEGREPVVEVPQAVVDLPLEARLPEEYVAEEAQKLELYRRLARARSPGDIAAFRQEVTDRFGPMPPAVVRLVEVAELRLTAEAAGVSSISREDGQLVVRFGAGLSRATAMRVLAGAALPGVRQGDLTFASNQVRIRLPRDPAKSWLLTQAVVARLSAAPRDEVAPPPTTVVPLPR